MSRKIVGISSAFSGSGIPKVVNNSETVCPSCTCCRIFSSSYEVVNSFFSPRLEFHNAEELKRLLG